MFTCFSVQNGLSPPFYPIISLLYFKILNHFLLEEACFYICVQNIYPSCILVSLFFYSFKIKWREQVINSITSFEKCHAVHEKGALPNVKLRGWDALEWKIPAILLFGTSYFFNMGTEALVKGSAPLFMRALALPAWFGAESPCKKQFSEKM